MCGKGCGLRLRSVALAEQGACTTQVPFPLSDGVTSLQAAPQEEPVCEMVAEGRAVLAAHGARRVVGCNVQGLQDALHQPGQALLVGVGGGNSPGAKMSVTLLRSYF